MSKINSFDEFKRLTEEERAFYVFDAIMEISEKMNFFCIDKLDERYAKKLVETIVFNGIKMVLVAFVIALIGLVIIR